MDTKAQAIKKAKELLGKMKTKGWKIRVWQNLGWHHSVINYGIQVIGPSGCREEKYSCYLSNEKDGGGSPTYWHDRNSYINPNEAVTKQLAKAHEFVNGLQDHLGLVEKSLK